jgi:hypothetical protein
MPKELFWVRPRGERDDSWIDFEAYDCEEAAQIFSESFDSDTAGEHFQDPTRDTLDIEVKSEKTGESTFYKVRFDYSKDFYFDEIVTSPQQSTTTL